MPATKTKIKKKLKGKKYLKFACGGCGRCCRLWIPVTGRDLTRLIEATGAPAEEIAQFTPLSQFKKDTPGELRVVKFGKRKKDRKVMCLRELRGRCLYLKKKRCIVYEHRPVVCREHPLMITTNAKDRKIRKIKINDPCGCKHTLDGKVTKRDLLAIYKQNQREDEAYDRKVDRWNERNGHGTERDFLAFLGLCK